MKKSIIAILASAAAVSAFAATLKLDVPVALISGTQVPFKVPNFDPYDGPQPEIQVPDGVKNVAKGKPVTSSDDFPVIGELTLITDGDKEAAEGCYVEIQNGLQWVQIDLQNPVEIYAIAVWHYHSQERAYKDVVIQVSDDPTFKKGVTTVYSNDTDNSSKLGKGAEKTYVETNYGKLVALKTPVKGRYVRLYSDGNTTNDMNHYTEVEVFAK